MLEYACWVLDLLTAHQVLQCPLHRHSFAATVRMALTALPYESWFASWLAVQLISANRGGILVDAH